MKDLIPTPAKIYLCGEPVDMRLGLPGLAKKVRADTNRDPREPALYVFINRTFSRVKLFWWDKNGYAMFYKCVQDGVFRVSRTNGYKTLTGVNLRALLSSRAERVERK
jgi:transposase